MRDAARHVGPAEMIDHQPHAGLADDRRGLDELVLLAMDLQEPAHLLDAREQAVRARFVELAHAVGGEIEADADDAGVGELRRARDR